MKHRPQPRQGKPTLDLIEESVHLVRTAPPVALTWYYVGSLPFVLGGLFYWAEMSRSPFAVQTHAPGAFGLALLFAWMKFCQALYGRHLCAHLAHHSAPRLTFRQAARVMANQAAFHATGLFLLPVLFVAALPFPWSFAVYQNFTVLGASDPDNSTPPLKRAIDQASLWRLQNVYLHLAGSGFALAVFLNWATVLYLVPNLLKTLLGIETVFSRSGWVLLNSTFFAAAVGLTYLSVDPLIKSAYALRCFQGQALESGADLQAELRRLRRSASAAVLVLMSVFCLTPEPALAADHSRPHPVLETGFEAAETERGPATQGPRLAPAQEPPLPGTAVQGAPMGTAPINVQARELERAIGNVLSQRKYAWRMPRERAPKAKSEPGLFARFFADLGETIKKGMIRAIEWLGDMLRRIFQPRWRLNPSTPGYGWMVSLQLLLYVLLAAAVGACLYLIYRHWRSRHGAGPLILSQPIQPAPDLTHEHVAPDELPEDGWVRMGRELMAQGEFRLALRAWYLASLAHLANRRLITLAQFKSNLEYERELRRRAHSLPQLLTLFDENLGVLERVWYGRHPADAEDVRRFVANLELMRAAHSNGGAL
jgi:hypothetical protein